MSVSLACPTARGVPGARCHDRVASARVGVVAGKRARTASGSENVTISTWSSTMVDRRAGYARRARALRAESRVSARALIIRSCPRSGREIRTSLIEQSGYP